MTHASLARDSSSRYSRLAGQLFCLAALLILAVSVSGCAKLQARDLLNKGVAAFKNAQFDTAVEDFKRAKELDPDLINARLYLATAYASQYIPGAPSDENMRHGQEAVAEYREVLEKDANNLNAIDGLASIETALIRDGSFHDSCIGCTGLVLEVLPPCQPAFLPGGAVDSCC